MKLFWSHLRTYRLHCQDRKPSLTFVLIHSGSTRPTGGKRKGYVGAERVVLSPVCDIAVHNRGSFSGHD